MFYICAYSLTDSWSKNKVQSPDSGIAYTENPITSYVLRSSDDVIEEDAF